MVLSETDRRLVGAVQGGLPLEPRPYRAVAEAAGLSEPEVIDRLAALVEAGVIRRMGLVVRHHEFGYRANAMAVWDVPDDRVAETGRRMGGYPFVTLCYRRRRAPPDWPYNLYCMIHGRDRAAVSEMIARLTDELGLAGQPHEVLFSRRRFKQRGAIYAPPPTDVTATEAPLAAEGAR